MDIDKRYGAEFWQHQFETEREEHKRTRNELGKVTRELDQIKDNIVRLADRYKPIEPEGGWKSE